MQQEENSKNKEGVSLTDYEDASMHNREEVEEEVEEEENNVIPEV